MSEMAKCTARQSGTSITGRPDRTGRGPVFRACRHAYPVFPRECGKVERDSAWWQSVSQRAKGM